MLWDNVRKVSPYVPGEQPREEGIIKLNTNECPYPPSERVAWAIARFDAGSLRKYPDPDASDLNRAIAGYLGVDEGMVFAGVGSDDVLAMSFITFFNSEKPVFFPDITYSFYPVWADLFNIKYETKPLRDGFSINPDDYRAENGGVIFPNPNAPTSLAAPLPAVEEIIRANRDVVVIVDEAYIDFGGESALPLLKKYDNLLVVRTFSKSRAMAGMRIGFAVGNEKLISALKAVKFSFNSYTMSSVAIAAGIASIEDEKHFMETVEKIKGTRERAKQELGLLGFSFPEPAANFLFVKHESLDAAYIFKALKQRGIYVRYFDGPLTADRLRITVGTDAEMKALCDALSEIVQSAGKMSK